MFHPVGPQPPSVYWRRRLVFIASIIVVLVLVVLTVNAMRASSAAKQSAAPRTTPPPTASFTPASTPASAPSTSSKRAPSTTSAPAKASSVGRSSSGNSAQHSGPASSSAPPAAPAAACRAKDLAVQAVPAATSYHVGDKPVLQLQVTDTAATPCVQNLADSQVELRVYNGESRVWGSHDCKIQPGAALRTLAPATPVRVAINWSGLSSEPKCAGTRQRVGAGTYTLYALLAGRTGKAAQFSIS
ncbi:hypothetical protein [uncultured Jatrophihabitans sp.]|uniref:hypothetical protein n=1 Tax=uncultured Jatrophihabitans sp. TaxID=1610747 RepID=UPI0035C9CDB2